jgi:hypothetical protein
VQELWQQRVGRSNILQKMQIIIFDTKYYKQKTNRSLKNEKHIILHDFMRIFYSNESNCRAKCRWITDRISVVIHS